MGRGLPADPAKGEPVKRIDARAVRERLSDVDAFLDALALPRRPMGAMRLIRCPVHTDERPSCTVRLERDRTISFHCWSCGATGDALTLLAHVRGYHPRRDFRKVVDEAARIAGVTASAFPAAPPLPPTARLAMRIDQAASAWLRGRDVPRDDVLETAPRDDVRAALGLLFASDRCLAAERRARDEDLERRALTWESACTS